MKHLAMVFVAALSVACTGGEPLRWTRTPANASPAAFTTYHGQSLDLECTFKGFGALPFEGEDVHLYWQTNGMDEAWWSMPATVASNTVSATFSPVNDTGADRMTFFFGVPGNAYAAAIVRFLPSPDFAPSTMPPPPVLADTVRNIVTNEVTEPFAGEWRVTYVNPDYRINGLKDELGTYDEHGRPSALAVGSVILNESLSETASGYDHGTGTYTYRISIANAAGVSLTAMWAKAEASQDATEIEFLNEWEPHASVIRLEKIPIKSRNVLGLAMLKDLEGKADAAITNEIGEIKKEATLVYCLFSGSNIVMEVTNYNSRVNPPAMKQERLNDEGIYEVMWTETNGLERTYNRAASNTAEKVAALERKAAETYAPRGWAATTSGLGADAPKNTTWISTPTTVIAGGLEYSKVVTSSGQLWFLRSNGMVANVGGNSGGYFDISAADGTSVFSIEKTDSYMAPVDSDGISVNGNTITIPLSVVSANHPFLRYAQSLEAPVTWQKEEDGFSSPIAVSWSGSSGAWVATVTTTAKEGFFQFEFFQEGGTKIKSGGAMDVSTGGILCTDGKHKCRPVYNSNGTITWEAF